MWLLHSDRCKTKNKRFCSWALVRTLMNLQTIHRVALPRQIFSTQHERAWLGQNKSCWVVPSWIGILSSSPCDLSWFYIARLAFLIHCTLNGMPNIFITAWQSRASVCMWRNVQVFHFMPHFFWCITYQSRYIAIHIQAKHSILEEIWAGLTLHALPLLIQYILEEAHHLCTSTLI